MTFFTINKCVTESCEMVSHIVKTADNSFIGFHHVLDKKYFNGHEISVAIGVHYLIIYERIVNGEDSFYRRISYIDIDNQCVTYITAKLTFILSTLRYESKGVLI